MFLSGIYLVAYDFKDTVNFYAQTLGLKEIERTPDVVALQEREFIKKKKRNKSNTIALQGKDIRGCLVLGSYTDTKGEKDEELACISFTVDNLDNIVQKLEDANVKVKLKNYDDGTQRASFSDPNDVRIVLTTANPPDMSGGEETEIRIDGLALKTNDVEDSVQFYTHVLGLKEIEGWTYEANKDYVGLQAGDIVIKLLKKGWLESKGFDHIDFTVNNWDNTVRKLENADVDVDFLEDETGETVASLYDPDEEVQIILSPLAERSETQIPMPDEEAESPDGNTERPSIAEKVRFWEEQDRINQELIPRVIRQNELLTQHIAEHDNLQQILSDTIQKALSEQAQQYESALDTVQKQLNETHEKNTQKTLAEQAQQYQSALDTTQKQLNETHAKALEPLRQEARQTRNRLTAIAAGSAIIAIAALIVAFLN